MVQVGDRIQIESEKVGSTTRVGVVTAIEGRLLTVRWDGGRVSVFVPSAGSMRVLESASDTPKGSEKGV